MRNVARTMKLGYTRIIITSWCYKTYLGYRRHDFSDPLISLIGSACLKEITIKQLIKLLLYNMYQKFRFIK